MQSHATYFASSGRIPCDSASCQISSSIAHSSAHMVDNTMANPDWFMANGEYVSAPLTPYNVYALFAVGRPIGVEEPCSSVGVGEWSDMH